MKESEKARVQTNRCCHNTDLESTDFHVAFTPKPSMCFGIRETLAALVVRRVPKKRFAPQISLRFLCAHASSYMTACLFVRTCLYVTYTNKNLGNERVTTFLSTQVHEACAHS